MNKSESKYFNTAVKMDLALISLLKEKPFEYITVSEICKKAGVNRSTFYLHYETIGDLLEETTRYLLNDFWTYFTEDVKSVKDNLNECELHELVFISDKYLSPFLTYVKDNKEIFITIMLHYKTFNFEDVHKEMFNVVYNTVLDKFGYPKENRNYVMMYYLNGIMAVITEWIKEDCSKPIEDIMEIITGCTLGLKNNSERDIHNIMGEYLNDDNSEQT
ncbi:MAG: TetR/AcrR family transcriptional regulator [Clostridia bacterium]|nr:TetR/AcrR family transcriptional regulator [Clostridia bacterium]